MTKRVSTPAEVDSARRQTLGDIADQMVDRIEASLLAGGYPVRVSLANQNRQAMEIVVERYRAAGWEVLVVDDSRDGDYLEINRRGR